MIILKLISQLPLVVLYTFSDFLFFAGYRVLGYRREMVRKNLKNSFPEKSDEELKIIEKTFYKNLCDYAVETLKLLTIPKAELTQRIAFKNPEAVRPHTDSGQSILLLASHQFNWEWLLAAGSYSLQIPIDFVYLPQRSTVFNDFSLKARTRFGAYAIEREKVGWEAVRRKNIVRGTAIVADQFPGHFNHRRYWTTFMGQRTAFFFGISQLATLMQSPVFFAAITKVKRGFYEVELIKISKPPFDKDNSSRIIDNYIEATEKIIRQHPEGWLWSHNRWKEWEE